MYNPESPVIWTKTVLSNTKPKGRMNGNWIGYENFDFGFGSRRYVGVQLCRELACRVNHQHVRYRA